MCSLVAWLEGQILETCTKTITFCDSGAASLRCSVPAVRWKFLSYFICLVRSSVSHRLSLRVECVISPVTRKIWLHRQER